MWTCLGAIVCLSIPNGGLFLSSLSFVAHLKITCLVVLFCCRNRDPTVGMVPTLSALRPLNRGWIPGGVKRSFSSSNLPDQSLCQLASCAVGSGGSFPRGKMTSALRWPSHIHPNSGFRKLTNVHPLTYIILWQSQKECFTLVARVFNVCTLNSPQMTSKCSEFGKIESLWQFYRECNFVISHYTELRYLHYLDFSVFVLFPRAITTNYFTSQNIRPNVSCWVYAYY
jgi:hypothetical protein